MGVYDNQTLGMGKRLSKNLTLSYMIALFAIALLSIVGQILVHMSLNAQLKDSVAIIAGRQRMLSQKICKSSALLSSNLLPESEQVRYLKELKESLELWHDSHFKLKNGGKIKDPFINDPNIKVENNDSIKAEFNHINPFFLNIYINALEIVYQFEYPTKNRDQNIRNSLSVILANESNCLQGMNKIVYLYNKKAKERVAKLKQIEIGLLITTLTILLLEALFIFRPAVRYIQKTFDALIISENETRSANQELKLLNEQLKKTKDQLVLATEEKYQLQIKEQKVRSVALVAGQEQERKRIAKDLHDGLGQMMTALKLTLENLDVKILPEREKLIVEDAKSLLVKTMVETRAISFNLMPVVLNDFGIVSGLKLLAEQVSKTAETKVAFSCKTHFERPHKDLEIGLYRIAQEAINNAVKYAQATNIDMDLQLVDSEIILQIFDNGKGLSLQRNIKDLEINKFYTGISNMKERTHLLNGSFQMESVQNKGTRVIVQLPVA